MKVGTHDLISPIDVTVMLRKDGKTNQLPACCMAVLQLLPDSAHGCASRPEAEHAGR